MKILTCRCFNSTLAVAHPKIIIYASPSLANGMNSRAELTFLISAPVSSRVSLVRKQTRNQFPVCQTVNSNESGVKDVTLEPSYPQAIPAQFPKSLLSSTIYHNIPSVPKHHVAGDIVPLEHRNDGDGYVLAISFPSSTEEESWIRGRFVRTRPFFVESRAGKRVYRGLYGTPGAVGLSAPVKPKASCAKGVFEWGDPSNSRIVTYGLRTLPLSVSRDVLVTKGPTALGSVLTDSEELLQVRATELSVSPLYHESSWFTVGISRTAAGNTIGAFVCELNEAFEVVNRFPKLAIPSSCNITSAAVCEEYVVLALHRIKEEAGGLFSAVFGTGKQKKSPNVDIGFGTLLLILSRSSGQCASCKLEKTIVTKLTTVSVSSGSLKVTGIELALQNGSQIMRLSTIADVGSGHLWRLSENVGRFSSQLVRLSIEVGNNKKAVTAVETGREPLVKQKDIMITDTMFVPAGLKHASHMTQLTPFIVYDESKHRSGVAAVDSNGSLCSIWRAEDETVRLSGGCLSPDGNFMSILMTTERGNGTGATIAIFDMAKIEDGPAESIMLKKEEFGVIHESVAGIWTAHSSSWNIDAKKPLKSSYEMFDSHNWNDINSNFSSLGL